MDTTRIFDRKATTLPKGAAKGAATAFGNAIPQSFIDTYIKHPGEFLVPSAAARAAAIDVVGKTYDAANVADKFGLYDDWSAVVNSGFDANEQLWELVSFRNEPVLSYSADMMKQLSRLLESVRVEDYSESDSASDLEEEDDDQRGVADPDAAEVNSEDEDNQDVDDSSIEEELLDSDAASLSENGNDNDDEDEEEEEKRQTRRSEIDDDFFSLAEMERFADEAEEEDMRDRAILAGDYPKNAANESEGSDESDEDDDADMFQDLAALDDGGEDGDIMDVDGGDHRPEEMMYADFFAPPKWSKRGMAKAARERHAKRVKFDPTAVRRSETDSNESDIDEASGTENGDEESPRKTDLFDDDDNDAGSGTEAKSEFQKRQEKLQGLISKLEDEAVDAKHWTMTGEVTSSARPKDSLLGESLEFDYVQKPVPVVTQEVTQTLEDIIRRRILNEEWDDVERKKDIQAKPFRPSGFIELNDKQSKKSLAQEYEDQYVAQKSGDQFVPEKDAKLDELHREIKGQMRSLFTQLDALSHFHYAPKPATADIEIRTNTPALAMEEKLPVNVSHAEQLAPEEIYEKNKGYDGRTGDLKGDTELSREDRKRRRQRKKAMYKKKTAATIEGGMKATKSASASVASDKVAPKPSSKFKKTTGDS